MIASRHECSHEKWKHFFTQESAPIYFKKSFQNCSLISVSGMQSWKEFSMQQICGDSEKNNMYLELILNELCIFSSIPIQLFHMKIIFNKNTI